ncbi:tyrosine-type recombinase/integrase [Pseudoalteromonas ruthenica]|uniref:Integrase n=1 Tax=Pseudoalteromonas ruthenica TaxID=151081 RepID=A0A0F4PFW6_9GAMM|nr:site-specific integrase [Pseudoalteromonas ruthenica]KJY93933.1 integrase [Pseudoalteromonas ruthenica]KJY96423.1 integrase [Pseudoalteromonas ruthenica]TMO94589.1 site-specific integrase [Pseudoalteromonas ruthenica]TMO97252.1 site-specific integrase [Pseudoalteromonas ruthenica]TMP09206.1 site-specific integrase [Pseudoalteromonas ruthenica]
MNVKEIKANIKSCNTLRFSVGDGLYIKPNKGKHSGAWELRYTINGSRRFMTLNGSGFPNKSLAEARAEAAIIKQQIKNGIDPLAERARYAGAEIITFDDLFRDWYEGVSRTLKHPKVQLRYYEKDIKPLIGKLKVEDVNARDIRAIIQKVMNDGRPSIANKALLQCKQLFRHAQKLDITQRNPASAFNESDAGGAGKSRERALSFQEIETTLNVLRSNAQIFTRDNYLALVLLLIFGNRKTEITQAKWSEFDFDEQIWNLGTRNKKETDIKIPLIDEVMPIFQELKVRACGSEYLFPARKLSKTGHTCDNTLNHALGKMFGKAVSKKEYPNLLGAEGVKHFTIHDLRRTCRSLLAELGFDGHVVTRYLNHKIKGVTGVYNRYDYLNERRLLTREMANKILPLAKISTNPVEVL